jgi:hypothetical protein
MLIIMGNINADNQHQKKDTHVEVSVMCLAVSPFFYIGEWSVSRPTRFTPGKDIGSQRIAGWIGSRASLDNWKKENLLSLSEFEPWTIIIHKNDYDTVLIMSTLNIQLLI